MANPPKLHPYCDRASFERLMLLISAIANNPGIAPQGTGVSCMAVLLEAMKSIALEQQIDWQSWSENTIRKDLVTLRKYNILPKGTALRCGYYLGRKDKPNPPTKPAKAVSERDAAILQLRKEGKSLAEVGAVFGLSRERIRQIEAIESNEKK